MGCNCNNKKNKTITEKSCGGCGDNCSCGKDRITVDQSQVLWSSAPVFEFGIKEGDNLECIVYKIRDAFVGLQKMITNGSE